MTDAITDAPGPTVRRRDGAGGLPRPPAAVFLDLDGCLVDSTGAITGCLNHALVTLGLRPRPPAELVPLIGPPLHESLAALLAADGADPALVEAGVEAYRSRYAVVALTETAVIPGIPAALEQLAALTRLAVVTSKPRAFAVPLVEGLGLDRWLEAVYGPDLDHRVEPKAVTLRRALAATVPGVAAARTVMVGDRSHDVAAGRACGTATIGVTWGAGARAELVAAGADHVVDRPEELVAALR
jgi:phosphoglycolate phosphatase